MTGTALAWAGFGLVAATWVQYMSTIPRGKVPARPIGAMVAQAGGLALTVYALAVGYSGSGWLALLAWATPIGLAFTLGGLFFFLLSQRKTPLGKLQVAVGEQFLPFTATTAGGDAFETDELGGRRVLLKFFRGYW